MTKLSLKKLKQLWISIDEDPQKAQKSLDNNSMREELLIMEKLLQNPEAFSACIRDGRIAFTDSDGEESVQKLSAIETSFVPEVSDFAKTFTIGGTNLSETPNTNPSKNSSVFLFLLPILSGLMQLALTFYMQYMQKKKNPDMPDMGGMNIMLYGMPLFSVWLAFTVPAGVGFYWLCSSVFSFIQSVILYAWFNDERVEKIGEIEREKAKQQKRRPSMMQMMLEQQEEMMRQQNGGTPAKLSGRSCQSCTLFR